MAKINIEKHEEVEYENNEITQIRRRESQYTIRTEEPDYVKLYIKAWCEFKQVKGVNFKFLCSILPYMSYAEEKQLIVFSSCLKRIIAKNLKWAEGTALVRFNTELKKLVNSQVLRHYGRDTYQVNPELIGRGQWKNIKNLRATFNLSNGEITHQYTEEKEE